MRKKTRFFRTPLPGGHAPPPLGGPPTEGAAPPPHGGPSCEGVAPPNGGGDIDMTSFRYNGGKVANRDGAANTCGHPLPCSFRQGVSRSPRRRGVFSLA